MPSRSKTTFRNGLLEYPCQPAAAIGPTVGIPRFGQREWCKHLAHLLEGDASLGAPAQRLQVALAAQKRHQASILQPVKRTADR